MQQEVEMVCFPQALCYTTHMESLTDSLSGNIDAIQECRTAVCTIGSIAMCNNG